VGYGRFKEAPPKKERVEINGAIRDVLELTRDEVTPRVRRAPRCLSKTGGTHARTALLDDDTPAYRMHDQR